MKYISKTVWRDLTDNHLYQKGDEFPHDGRDIPEKRIAELTGTQNKVGYALLEAVEVVNEGISTQEPEQPSKPKRSRKKTV